VTASPGRREAEGIPTYIDVVAVAEKTWVGGVVILSVFLSIGYLRLRAIRRSCSLVSQGVAFDAVSSACVEFGLSKPQVRVGRLVVAPFVAGILRPTLYLPVDWDAANAQEVVEAICRHEMAHLSAKDLHWSLAFRLSTILFWPQPLIWILKRLSAVACEDVCDQKVLACGYAPERYASALLEMRETLRASPKSIPIGLGAVTTRSSFGRRIETIMNQTGTLGRGLSRTAIGGWMLTSVTVGALGASLFALPMGKVGAGLFAMRQTPPQNQRISVRIQTPDAKPASCNVGLVFVSDKGETRFEPLAPSVGKIELTWTMPAGFSSATLVAMAPGYGLTFTKLWPAERPVSVLRLNPETTLTGQVLLPDGKPAVGLRVVAAQLSRESADHHGFEFLMVPRSLEASCSGKTDAEGRFRISGLPQGFGVDLNADDARFATTIDYVSRTALSAGQASASKPIRLRPGATFEGRVTRNGRPVANVRVAAQGNHAADMKYIGLWAEAVSDSDGKYRLERLIAGHYNISVDLQDTLNNEVTAVAHEDVEIAQGGIMSALDFELVPGGVIEGTVTGPDGSPQAGAMLGVYGPAHPNSSAWVQGVTTDKNGHYVLRVPAGKNRVYVMSAGPIPSDDRTIQVVDGQKTTLDLVTK
jgi:beta-lactamase regulating signal transducer with metallopeptidase domain